MRTPLLPPTGRDFEVYRLVKLHRKSTRDVAYELTLSQTRICQIVVRVGNFLRDVSPQGQDDPQRGRLLNLEQVASERIDYLYGKSLESYHDSRGSQLLIKRQPAEGLATVKKESFGEPKYLLAAGRFAMHGAKLPAAQLESFVRWEEEEEVETPAAMGVMIVEVEDEAREVVELESLSPPVEDCSQNSVQPELATPAVAADDVESPVPSGAYAISVAVASRPNFGNSETVQPPPHGKQKRAAARRKAFLSPVDGP